MVSSAGRLRRGARWAHLPRRTVRLRLTLLYGALFLLSGAALLATTYFLVDAATGNAFIAQGKNGVTFAGFQIGAAPLGPKGGALSISGGTQAQVNHRVAGSAHGGGGTGGRGTVTNTANAPAQGASAQTQKGPGQTPPTPAQLKHQQDQVAQMTRQLETLAHTYQSRELQQLLVESGVALGIMALLSVGLGWIVAGRVLRPLRVITSTTRDISVSNLHERLSLHGPDDELKELGDTIDGLLERLDASFRSQRQFVANASHELRTPLARQRALAQVALSDPGATSDSLRAAHERILASGEQQEQLIDALLTLSRAQAGAVTSSALDLAPLVRDLLTARGAEAEARGVRLQPTLVPTPLRGDPRLVERLVANLLDNALRHNVAGGTVVVRTAPRDGGGRLEVCNDGPMVDPGQIEALFEPFERLGAERTNAGEGFGLGLCIVKAIATAHGATLVIAARPAGGLDIEVLFPPEPTLTAAGAASTAGAASIARGGNETVATSGGDAALSAGSGPAGRGGRLPALRSMVVQASPPAR